MGTCCDHTGPGRTQMRQDAGHGDCYEDSDDRRTWARSIVAGSRGRKSAWLERSERSEDRRNECYELISQ